MSLITQCPACATMFRVVPDQLRISEGWVRCGQCEEVFDANAHLRALDEAAPMSAPDDALAQPSPPLSEEIPAPPPPVPQAQKPQPAPADIYDWGPVIAPQEPDVLAPPEMDLGTAADTPVVPPEQAHEPYWDVHALHQDADAPVSEPGVDSFLAHNPHEQSADAIAVEQAPVEAPFEESQALEPDHVPVSFMVPRAQPTPARRKLGKYILSALCLVLVLLLGLQVLLRERDRLAASAPALRPVLASICAPLGCSISAPRQIEAIAIESSSFTSLKPGVYVLNVVLKNAAALDLATPSLELTLTDTQDQAIVRRVLAPAAFGSALEITSGAERSASIPLQVDAAAAVQKIAGYKLLAFYP